MGIWGGCGEALIKRGHAVGLGYFLVLIPSKECGAIGCAINLGRARNSACRFAHGAGQTRFLRVRCTARVRANILNFPARIFGSEGVSAHFGSGAESNTQKPASFSLEFRKKGHRESWSDLCTLYHYIPLGKGRKLAIFTIGSVDVPRLVGTATQLDKTGQTSKILRFGHLTV